MNMYTTNSCYPILALSPFTETIIRTGEQGETGLSGPNVELISFNSGDSTLAINDSSVVGLGVAKVVTNSIFLPQLGVVMNQTGTLSNFEIGYSGRIVSSSNVSHRIDYILFVIKSSNNSGNDYTVQNFIEVFFGGLEFPTITPPDDPEDVSVNKLIIVPIASPNVNVGDRVVLLVNIIRNFGSDPLVFESLTVQASVHFTPST